MDIKELMTQQEEHLKEVLNKMAQTDPDFAIVWMTTTKKVSDCMQYLFDYHDPMRNGLTGKPKMAAIRTHDIDDDRLAAMWFMDKAPALPEMPKGVESKPAPAKADTKDDTHVGSGSATDTKSTKQKSSRKPKNDTKTKQAVTPIPAGTDTIEISTVTNGNEKKVGAISLRQQVEQDLFTAMGIEF